MNPVTETRQPGPLLDGPVDGAARGIVETDAVAARLVDDVVDEDHAAFAGAAVIVADGKDSGGNRRRRRDWRFPDGTERAAAQDGAPAPWSATPTRMASSRRRSASVGLRP